MEKNTDKFDVDSLRVAKPCNVPWSSMPGDSVVRNCSDCRMNVYNIEGMSEAAVRDLVASREDRLCIRLHRRGDGTVITADCPKGLAAFRKRTARIAASVFASVIGLFSASASFGQADVPRTRLKDAQIVRKQTNSGQARLHGTVVDGVGALIPNAPIKLLAGKAVVAETRSDAEGKFELAVPSAGTFDLSISFMSGEFKPYRYKGLKISAGEEISLGLTLESVGEIIVGMIFEETRIDVTSNEVVTVLTADKIRRIPH